MNKLGAVRGSGLGAGTEGVVTELVIPRPFQIHSAKNQYVFNRAFSATGSPPKGLLYGSVHVVGGDGREWCHRLRHA